MKKTAADFFSILLKAIMCGICMYLAVSIYKEKNNIIGILFFIPIFISCGWEHSIALVAYYALSGTFYILPLAAAVLGNTIGAKLIYEINEKAKSKI